MNVPEDLRYSSDHEWARVEGESIRVGITDFAQDNLGDVVYLQLPEVGARFEAGASVGEVESTKSVSEIYSPLAGEIVEINTALEDQPDLLNRDPYGERWICVLRLDSAAQVESLLNADGYKALLSD